MNTRKKVNKIVFKHEDDSEAESGAGDFSDSGSEAKISDLEHDSSGEETVSDGSAEDFDESSSKAFANSSSKVKFVRKPKFAKNFIKKIEKQNSNENDDAVPTLFSVKDMTEADKLLPSVLNLSESDNSDDESSKPGTKRQVLVSPVAGRNNDSDNEDEPSGEYQDVWSKNVKDNSEEVAKKTFLELEQHKSAIEETKTSLLNYKTKATKNRVFDVKDLLAQGEEVIPEASVLKKKKVKRGKDDSDSEMEDWEEVNDAKPIPKQGLEVIVDFPDGAPRKTKKLDIEMMMKRKLNRVKKEYQVYMHKVHVLCWLGHGNYVSKVLNDQDIMAAALALVPSKECYPGERVDMKYVEQITTWYRDKLTLKLDKNEDKFRPKAPPLKKILLTQMKNRVVSAKKNLVFIFVSLLRALGLQCRVMFNFVTLPIKPPATELCSLSTKQKEDKTSDNAKDKDSKAKTESKGKGKKSTKNKSTKNISQVDGAYDEATISSDDDYQNFTQLDGNDDLSVKPKSTRTKQASAHKDLSPKNDNITVKSRNARVCGKKPAIENIDENDVSPPKRVRKNLNTNDLEQEKPKAPLRKTKRSSSSESAKSLVLPARRTRKSVSPPHTPLDVAPPPKKVKKIESDKSDVTKKSDKQTKTTSRVSRNSRSSSKSVEIKQKIDTPDSENLSTLKKASAEKDITQKRSVSKQSARTRTAEKKEVTRNVKNLQKSEQNIKSPPKIIVTDESNCKVESEYFDNQKSVKKLNLSRKRSQTIALKTSELKIEDEKHTTTKRRSKSNPGTEVEKSKYFNGEATPEQKLKTPRQSRKSIKQDNSEDTQRVSHKDLLAKSKTKARNDVTGDLVNIIKNRVKLEKEVSKKGIVKGKLKPDSDGDSDYLPEASPKRRGSESDDDFKPTKISPKARNSTSGSGRKIDRRVLSSDDDTPKNKSDVWCEVFVEELEQWICVDVIKGKVHCESDIYKNATHPVCYIVGWDNNNHLKDVTRRYVPHWNTVTRKQRAEPAWWDKAVRPWQGPKTAKDREEDDQLNRMQLEAPLPTSIAEYKNHPLYALKRHLLKFEALYPPDAAVLGFVRKEPVYARECVYVCRSRDTWLKEAKVVRLGEKPYKVVKARPKWDRLSNKLITDKPLEVFGPWQVGDYEPPVAENGVVPRNAYGNVELFKQCMLPKGTAHVKLPGLNRVAKKLNIDCAPAMTGFDFNGGWSHPVYDGFVVCKEFEEVITQAWLEDQEEQERKEIEKLEARVYGNWRRLIKGLLIRERVKSKYGFENPAPAPSQDKKKKAPRFVAKKK